MSKRGPLQIRAFKHIFFADIFCGSRWYRFSDWKLYGLFGKLKYSTGFSIGPILFYREG